MDGCRHATLVAGLGAHGSTSTRFRRRRPVAPALPAAPRRVETPEPQPCPTCLAARTSTPVEDAPAGPGALTEEQVDAINVYTEEVLGEAMAKLGLWITESLEEVRWESRHRLATTACVLAGVVLAAWVAGPWSVAAGVLALATLVIAAERWPRRERDGWLGAALDAGPSVPAGEAPIPREPEASLATLAGGRAAAAVGAIELCAPAGDEVPPRGMQLLERVPLGGAARD